MGDMGDTFREMRAEKKADKAKLKFHDAAGYVITFGKHAGMAIDQIAATDDGLRYLDWIRGKRAADLKVGDRGACVDRALADYLDDPTIAADLAKIMGHR